MGNLIKLSTSKGRDIRILDDSAVKYEDIGTILLKDHSGARVRAITKTALGDTVVAVRMIYERWIQEDEDHSWKKLAKCFRDVQLNSLASDIEQHFGLPSPSSDQGVYTFVVLHVISGGNHIAGQCVSFSRLYYSRKMVGYFCRLLILVVLNNPPASRKIVTARAHRTIKFYSEVSSYTII